MDLYPPQQRSGSGSINTAEEEYKPLLLPGEKHTPPYSTIGTESPKAIHDRHIQSHTIEPSVNFKKRWTLYKIFTLDDNETLRTIQGAFQNQSFSHTYLFPEKESISCALLLSWMIKMYQQGFIQNNKNIIDELKRKQKKHSQEEENLNLLSMWISSEGKTNPANFNEFLQYLQQPVLFRQVMSAFNMLIKELIQQNYNINSSLMQKLEATHQALLSSEKPSISNEAIYSYTVNMTRILNGIDAPMHIYDLNKLAPTPSKQLNYDDRLSLEKKWDRKISKLEGHSFAILLDYDQQAWLIMNERITELSTQPTVASVTCCTLI